MHEMEKREKDNKKLEQAGAELGQAQHRLGLKC